MTPMPMLVLLHSPLVGPLTWRPAATSLRAAGYQEVADEAERIGWLVVREPADHLAMLTRPATIAGLLDRLVKALMGAGPNAKASPTPPQS